MRCSSHAASFGCLGPWIWWRRSRRFQWWPQLRRRRLWRRCRAQSGWLRRRSESWPERIRRQWNESWPKWLWQQRNEPRPEWLRRRDKPRCERTKQCGPWLKRTECWFRRQWGWARRRRTQPRRLWFPRPRRESVFRSQPQSIEQLSRPAFRWRIAQSRLGGYRSR
jgi:hypothetical protein